MARHIPFEFKGTEVSKFFIAGMNYVSKVPTLKRDKPTLITYLTNNKEEVCNDGCSKGFCTGQCQTCKVQGAYEKGLIIIALKPEHTSEKKLPARQRHGKSWQEFRQEREY